MLCACDCRGISSSTPHSILFASASAGDHAVKVWKAEIPPSLFVSASSLSDERSHQKKKEGRSDGGHVGGGVCTPQVLMTSLASVAAHRKEINDLQISPNDSVRYLLSTQDISLSSHCLESPFLIIVPQKSSLLLISFLSLFLFSSSVHTSPSLSLLSSAVYTLLSVWIH